MAIKILIVEDEPLMSSKMEMQIDKLGHELFGVLDSSDQVMVTLANSQPDLILMDVNILGNYDGIELADMIHEKWPIPVLFITSLFDDATFRRISRTNPLGYIQKPFTDAQLKHSMQLVIKQIQNLETQESTSNQSDESINLDNDYIFIKHRNRLDKIKIKDILFIEADGRYCQIHLGDNKYLSRITLKKIKEQLNTDIFIQTHRSFLVNRTKIKSIDLENSIAILDQIQVPISRREKDQIMTKLKYL